MKNLKTTIAALVCACSLAFQAKAANYIINGSSTTVPGGATAAVTSITATNASSSARPYNNGSAPDSTTVTNGVAATFSFRVVINDISQIHNGDVITIPFTTQAGGHFAVIAISSGNTAQPDSFFTVKWNGSAITLTATDKVSGGGAVEEDLTGTTTMYTTGDSPTQLGVTSTTFTVNGNNYQINSQATTLTAGTACTANFGSAAGAGYANSYMSYSLNCLYNQLLSGTAVSNLSGVDLSSDFIQVIHIPASSQILSISWTNQNSNPYINYVLPNKSSVAQTSLTNWNVSQTFTNITVPAGDTTMADLESYLPNPGDRTIIQNSDGSYTIASNWGPLLGNTLNEYPSTAAASTTDPSSVALATDPNAQALVQEAINGKLAALINRQSFTVTMANTSVSDTVTGVTVKNNINLPPAGSTIITSNPTVAGGSGGQTSVVVNYVNLNGTPIQAATPLLWGNAGTTNTIPAPQTNIQVTAANGTVNNLTLLTDEAIADTVHVTNSSGTRLLITDAGQVLTGSASVANPPSGTYLNNQLQVYFVYAPSAGLPITGLQLTAQPQANNDVLLTWGTLTEINSKDFTVQRSADGGKTWITVGIQPTQAANGNSSVPLTYQLTDPTVQVGEYEYRIVETDVDGATTTSNVVQIVITGGGQVFPNPANTLLNVKLPASANSVPYRLISADGKIVLSGTITNTGNYGQISVAGIASDIYFLQITVNNTVQTYEVRIQH